MNCQILTGIRQADIDAVAQNPIGPCLAQGRLTDSRCERRDSSPRALSGTNPGWNIFENHALLCRKSKQCRPFQKRFGIRFPVRDVVRCDHLLRYGKPGGFDPYLSKGARARRDDRPTIGRQASQQIECTGQRNHPVKIFDFTTFDLAILCGVIRIRKILAYGGQAGAPVRARYHLVRIESVLNRPLSPNPGHCRR